MKNEMINFIHATRGYSKAFLRTRTEDELENYIIKLGLVEAYGSEAQRAQLGLN